MAVERMRRVDEAIRQVLAEALSGELSDPRLGFITVTDVKTSPDLRAARVYVSVLGDEDARADSLAALGAPTACCRARIATQLHARSARRACEFVYDGTTDRALRVESLLRRRRCERGDLGGDQRRASRCFARSRAGERFALVTHENLDGDALGSLVAMQALLRALGKDAVMVIAPEEFPLPPEYSFFALDGRCTSRPRTSSARTTIFLDCGNLDRNPLAALREAEPLDQHRPPSRQHPLRHRQPRRRRVPPAPPRSSGTCWGASAST